MALTSEAELQELAAYIRNAVLDAMVFTLGGDRTRIKDAIRKVPEMREYYQRQVNELIDEIRSKG